MLSPLNRKENQGLGKESWHGQDKDLGPDSHCSAPSGSFNCCPGESLPEGAIPTLTKVHLLPSLTTPPNPHPDGIPSDTGLGYSPGYLSQGLQPCFQSGHLKGCQGS